MKKYTITIFTKDNMFVFTNMKSFYIKEDNELVMARENITAEKIHTKESDRSLFRKKNKTDKIKK